MYALIIVVLSIALLHMRTVETFINKVKVCNDIDKQCYNVVSKYDTTTHQNASKLLANCNLYILKFIQNMSTKYIDKKIYTSGAFTDDYYYSMTKRLIENYDSSALTENSPNSDKNTSFVENKGTIFALCLREKSSGNNNLYGLDTLKFVILHELAHLASESYGHNEEFWTNFKILLSNAVEFDMYTPVDYKTHNTVYCSLVIDYNPLYDDRLLM